MASSSKGKSKSKSSRVSGYSGKGSGLKANNAGYSTTNRKGETTYFKSSKDAGGYNDSFEGKGTTSAGNPLKTVDSGGNVITPNKLQNTGVANIPGAPVVSDVGDIFNSNNQASATNIADFGFSYDKNKGFAPIPSVANDTVEASQGRSLQNMMARFGLQQAPESKADLYNSLKEKKDVDRARKEVNNYASQLNAISSNADAEALGLEGQGRGITESIIGGQQAQIRREAAIQALPVQAQLSAAQGNLDLAQQQLSTMFQLKSADADAKYNYRNKVIDSVYDFANAQEKQRLDDLKQIQLEKKAETKDFLNTQAQVLANALGQGAPASVYNAINNAKDKTALINAAGIYNGDVLGQQLKREQLSGLRGGSAGAPKVVSINGVDSTWNPQTGKFEAITMDGSSNLKPIKDAEIKDLSETWTAKNSALSLVDSLQKNIRENGTQNLFGKTSGQRTGDTTNLLLAMKNLEKTGALDAGTIKVLEGTIPSSAFFATEAAQVAALQSIKDTISGKVDEYVGSYRGTSAETDPRTQRIYKETSYNGGVSISSSDLKELDALFGNANTTTAAFDPANYY